MVKKFRQEEKVNANILWLEMVIVTSANEEKNHTILKGKRAEGLLPCANLSSFFIQSTEFFLVNQI